MIKQLIIQLNSDCNLNCRYCYSVNKIDLDKNNINKTVGEVLKKFPNINNVTLTGGEPLLKYEFLIEMLKNLKDKKNKTILTNGFLLSKDKIRKFKELDTKLRISIDSFCHGEKKINRFLKELILENNDYLKQASKVITEENLNFAYEDFVGLVKLGFNDIDVIPEMYKDWGRKERYEMLEQLNKVILFARKNNIKTNLTDKKTKKNRYYDCDKIRILPDGTISLCNSLNSTKKTYFLKNNEISRFPEFRDNIVKYALERLHSKAWFREEYLDNFCLIDCFYYNIINNQTDKWVLSAIELFPKIHGITKAEASRGL